MSDVPHPVAVLVSGTGRHLENFARLAQAGELPIELVLALSSKAAVAGFDWEADADLDRKVREEVEEFLVESNRGDREAMARELGDLLFVLVNIARRTEIDPEAALQVASDRFVSRFGHIEESLRNEGRRPRDATLQEMESLWEEAKRREME